MDTLLRDIRYAFRRCLRSPGFSCVAILSIGLGVGVNTAIFSIVNKLLLSAPPYSRVEQLVEVYPTENGSVELDALSYPEMRDLRKATEDVFSGVVTTSLVPTFENLPGRSQIVVSEVVSGNYFEVLGIPAIVGRTLLAEDDLALDAHPVVVLSPRYWQKRFGGDPGVVGKSVRLNGRNYTVLGVVPEIPSLLPGVSPDLYAPSMMVNQLQNDTRDIHQARGSHNLFATARMKPGVTLPQVRGVLERFAAETRHDYPDFYAESWGVTALPTSDVAIHPLFDRILFPAAAALMTIVGLVLMIACVNLASFLLARATDRKKEIAVRLAVGAGKWTLVRQLLTETVMLSLAGGAFGYLLSFLLLRGLGQIQLPTPVPFDLRISPDSRVLLFTLITSLLAGILFGLVPALQGSNPDLAGTLKNEGVVGRRPRRVTLRNALVVAQVAVSCLLLVGSGLFLRSLQAAQQVDPGFGHDPTAITWLDLPSSLSRTEIENFYRHLLDRVKAEPGIVAAGLVDNLALSGTSFNSWRVDFPGIDPPAGANHYVIDSVVVGPGYFEAAGVPLLSGRPFRWDDDPAADVLIVSQALVDRFWPGQDAIGKTILGPSNEPLRVIGVAANTNVRRIGESPIPYLYAPFTSRIQSSMQLVARTRREPKRVAQEIAVMAQELNPDVMILDAKSMEEHLGFMLFPFRVAGAMLSVFGGLTILLASIGLYGVVSYSIAGRTREIGLRMTLGSSRGRVIRLILREGMELVLIGMLVGFLMALSLSPFLGSLLFGIEARDIPAFSSVAVLLVAIGFLASYFPALRASRLDPLIALRNER